MADLTPDVLVVGAGINGVGTFRDLAFQGVDVLLVDTAGRLQTKVNLMEELKKIRRVMDKQLEGAPHEVLLVIDATTGQNGISQAKLFNDAVGVTGVALTKLDGTAKGGIVATITREMDLQLLKIRIERQGELLEQSGGAPVNLSDLEDIESVFRKKCERFGSPPEQMDELLRSFRELKESLD